MELTAEQESNGGHGSEVVVTCEHLGGDDDGVFQVELWTMHSMQGGNWMVMDDYGEVESWECQIGGD